MTIRPWSKRAAELRETDGVYHEITAWQEWLEEWNERQSESMQLELDALDSVPWFVAFCAACEETVELNKGATNDERDNESKTTG